MEALALIGDLGLNVVDDDEIARCKKYFTFYDEDKDGKLTYAELLSCMRVCGRNPSISEFKEMVTTIDSKLVRAQQQQQQWRELAAGRVASAKLFIYSPTCSFPSQDGALAFDDFMSLYVMQLKDGPNNEGDLIEAFQAFDKAGNGFIMVDDMKHVLTSMGTDRLTEEEADMMLKIADMDGDGVLSYEEVVKSLTLVDPTSASDKKKRLD